MYLIVLAGWDGVWYGIVGVSGSGESGAVCNVHVEDSRLFYENKWFHKGQHIFIESKEHGQERCVHVYT